MRLLPSAFNISKKALFTRFLSQADWILDKANIIAVMDENNGVYFMLQVHLFDTSKVEFLERRRIEPEASGGKQKQNIRLKRPQPSDLT